MRFVQRTRARLMPALLVLVAMFAIPAGGLSAQEAEAPTDWSQWRGPNRDGISSETGWSTDWPDGGPKKLWKASVGVGYSSMTVRAGRVYTMGNADGKDTVWCLDAATGKEVWKYSYSAGPGSPHKGTRCTPTVDDRYVFTLSRHGDLHCLNVKDGSVVWSKDVNKEFGTSVPTWGFACSLLPAGDEVILDVGPIVALDKSTGKRKWMSRNYGSAYSSPIAFTVDGKRHIASFPKSGLVVVDAANGREVARQAWRTRYDVHAVTPVISGKSIFFSSGYNVGGAMVELTGRKLSMKWRNKKMRNHFNNCVLWKGHLYGFDESTLKCMDFATGEEKWSHGGLGKGSLMLADGKLICMGDRGTLAVAPASPDGFKPLATAKVLDKLCWTQPLLSGGRIYCRNHPGDLVCLDVSGK